MQNDLGIAPEHWGWVLGAFVLAYGIFEIPSGALGDRIGQRRGLTRIVVCWSAFTCLTGLVSGFLPLVAVRLLFGAGEAGAIPNMSGCVARWFASTEQARAQGAIWAASRAGGVLAPWLVVPIMASLGWRSVFWVFGTLGFVWATFWFAWYRDDPAPPSCRHAECRPAGGTMVVIPAFTLLGPPHSMEACSPQKARRVNLPLLTHVTNPTVPSSRRRTVARP
jgi:ACS family glucarate transporter-like MFS transporter